MDITKEIEVALRKADEHDMLGGLAATHEERVSHRKEAEKLRTMVAEARALLVERSRIAELD